MLRRRPWSHAAFLLACGAWWACGDKRGLHFGDRAEVGLTTDSGPPGPDASALPDRTSDRSGPSASEHRGETGPDLDLAGDGVGDAGGDADALALGEVPRAATWDAGQADVAAETPNGDLQAAALDQGGAADTAGPVTATPSGGCVPGIVNPSLAYRGVLGIDFDEDGIADEVDRCPALATSTQSDGDGDGLGDPCDRCSDGADGDQDGVCDDADNCQVDWNPAQHNTDGDRLGDRCDSPRCFSSPGTEELQRILQRLSRKPEFTALLADAHWRVSSSQTHCRNDAVAVTLHILDYRHRKLVTVGYLVEADQLLSLAVADLTDLQGPQPSAEEGREAVYLAERDPRVGPILDSLKYRISAGAFFYEFGTQPENNDPAFPTCATGRCIDVLFSGSPPDGAYVHYSVVVEMDACEVLGIKARP